MKCPYCSAKFSDSPEGKKWSRRHIEICNDEKQKTELIKKSYGLGRLG